MAPPGRWPVTVVNVLAKPARRTSNSAAEKTTAMTPSWTTGALVATSGETTRAAASATSAEATGGRTAVRSHPGLRSLATHAIARTAWRSWVPARAQV